MHKILSFLFFVSLSYSAKPQGKIHAEMVAVPEIGRPCPDFTLNNVKYFSKTDVSLNDFKGKWLIIDFWAPYCIPCIKALPKINELNQQFKDKIQFLIIGWEGYKPNVSSLVYEKFKKRDNLSLPIAYGNNLFLEWKVSPLPHLIIIDDRGIVRAITYSSEINSAVLQDFITGKEVVLKNKKKQDDVQGNFDPSKPFLINDNGGPDTNFLYRSVLTKWTSGMPTMFRSVFQTGIRNTLLAGVKLKSLYKFAYRDTVNDRPIISTEIGSLKVSNYGEFWQQPILEMNDTSQFFSPDGSDINKYCYNLIVPQEKARALDMQEIMKRDLKSYFGYNAMVEERIMPCWYLMATDEARKKLSTNGGPKIYNDFYTTGFELRNVPVSDIIANLWFNNSSEPPFIDNTGIKGNIDIVIDTDLLNFDKFRQALQEKGLYLKKGEKLMKVIVVRDKQL